MVGRTTKDAAQYIGIPARAAERRRRLAVIDARLAALAGRRTALVAVLDDATLRRERLEGWLAQRPRHDAVLRAWATQDAREAVMADRTRARPGDPAGDEGRIDAAAAHTELTNAAAVHDLPTTADALEARSQALFDLARALDAQLDAVGRLSDDVHRWDQSSQVAEQERAILVVAQQDWEAARSRHRSAAAERDELARAEGASLAELDRRLAQLRDERADAELRQKQLSGEHDRLTRLLGQLGDRVEVQRAAVESAEPVLADARASLGRLSDVAGVVTAAGVVADDGSAVPLAMLDVATTQGIRAASGPDFRPPRAPRTLSTKEA